MSYVTYPLRLAWNNRVSLAGTTVTADVYDTSMPWSNVKNQIPAKIGRTTGMTVTVDITFDQAYDVTQFVMLNHNLAPGATVTLYGATNSNFTPAAVTAGLTITESLPLLWEFASTQTYQHWRVLIQHAAATTIQAGHMFLGTYDQLDLPNFATGLFLNDPSTRRKSYGGSTTVFQKNQFRIAKIAISPLQQTDRRVLETIYANIGSHTGAYVFLDPLNQRDTESPSTGLDGLHRFTIFGLFDREVRFQHMASDWQEVEVLTVEELI